MFYITQYDHTLPYRTLSKQHLNRINHYAVLTLPIFATQHKSFPIRIECKHLSIILYLQFHNRTLE